MAEAPRILLEHHLKRLKLPTFLREYEKLARQCAAEGLDHVQFLARLVELELIDREHRLVERRIKQAGFPVVKQLESFDFCLTSAPLGQIEVKGFSLCFRSHQMLIVLLRSRHGFRTVPGDVRELSDLEKLVSIAVRQAGGPVFGSN